MVYQSKKTPLSIKSAISYETAIEIISPKLCRQAMQKMKKIFKNLFPDHKTVSVIPILKAGLKIAEELAETFDISLNPMRMSYYREDTSRLDKPVCYIKPDISKIVMGDHTKSVVFTEAVVESQGTICSAMKIINDMILQYGKKINKRLTYPKYYTFALVSKTGEKPISIPNFYPLFSVDSEIWVIGYGCDLKEQGRDLDMIKGIISPYHTRIPRHPYYKEIKYII